VLRDTVRALDRLSNEPVAPPPAGWEGPAYYRAGTAPEFIKWLDGTILASELVLRQQKDMIDGKAVRDAYRLADKLNLQIGPQPTGQLTHMSELQTLRNLRREVVKIVADSEQFKGNKEGAKLADDSDQFKGNKRPKRSTERGEGRAILIAALTKHHNYGDNSCLNQEPIGNNALARLAGVSASTASAFFNNEFEGHKKYKALCRDISNLTAALKLLNNEFSPHLLYGRRPAGEGYHGDDGDE
jgi:hypothetical protein